MGHLKEVLFLVNSLLSFAVLLDLNVIDTKTTVLSNADVPLY